MKSGVCYLQSACWTEKISFGAQLLHVTTNAKSFISNPDSRLALPRARALVSDCVDLLHAYSTVLHK